MKCCKTSAVQSVLEKYSDYSGNLIGILQDIQAEYKYLPRELLEELSQETGIKLAKIYGVATFYTQFRLTPIGENLIMLCQGTACHVNGSKRIETALRGALKLENGADTTEDRKFTLENVACLGCCSLSPVMMIGDESYGNLTPDKAAKIVKAIGREG